jgi:phage terminase large subunit
VIETRVSFPARHYQKPVVQYFRGGGRHAYCTWHRKAGKDRTATFIESELAFKRVGLYWHALPRYEDARKVIWDAITPDGKRLIDLNFPDAICKKKNSHEMKIELINGSIWQPVGADNYNSLVGAFPVHVTWSEFALMNPLARQFIRPALAMAGGTELIITTPRGYNHAHALWQQAKAMPLEWYTSSLTVDDTKALSAEMLAEEKRSMPEELFRQEYYVDWSAANVGAILGRYVEEAEKEGRIAEVPVDPMFPVELSCDIGFRDTAAFWFWQARPDGFALVDYDEASGLDAEDWIERLKLKKHKYGTLWMPHDARAKTFQTKRSAHEQFMAAGFQTRIVPQTSKQDRINAARMVIPKCRFDRDACALGLSGLREWSFEYNEETKTFSRDPKHDWASHPGDGFSYGAQVMREKVVAMPKPPIQMRGPVTVDEFIKRAEARAPRHRRI